MITVPVLHKNGVAFNTFAIAMALPTWEAALNAASFLVPAAAIIKCSTAAVVSSPYCSNPLDDANVEFELEGSFSLASNNVAMMWRGRLCRFTASAKHNATGCRVGFPPVYINSIASFQNKYLIARIGPSFDESLI